MLHISKAILATISVVLLSTNALAEWGDIDLPIISPTKEAKPEDAVVLQKWMELREQFLADMRDPMKALQLHWVPASEILEVSELLGMGFHGTIFKARTRRGPVVIKFYWCANQPSDFRATIVQQILGRLKIAPHVYGVLNSEEVDLIIRKYPQMAQQMSQAAFGVIMELVPDAEPYKTPKLKNYDKIKDDQLEGIFDRINFTLGALRIFAGDLDLLISGEGRILVNDFDLYYVLGDDSSIIKFRGPPITRGYFTLSSAFPTEWGFLSEGFQKSVFVTDFRQRKAEQLRKAAGASKR